MAKANRLNFDAKIKAIDYLRAAAERYRTERPAFLAVAQELTKVVGIPISDKTANDYCKVAGVSWEQRRASPHQLTTLELGKQMRELSERVETLSNFVRELCRQLDYPTPAIARPQAKEVDCG